MMMKCSILKAFKDAMSEEENAKNFLEKIEKYFAKNEKAKTSTFLANIVSMNLKENGT